MASESRNELVLDQSQYAYVQDSTKGGVSIAAGPFKTGLTTADRPVKYDPVAKKFIEVSLEQSICQNPIVPEGSYVVLENPAKEQDKFPTVGNQNPVPLQIGKKLNLRGPLTFSLWPQQHAEVIDGHQLHSNEYLVVRIYNIEEAERNWPADVLEKTKEANVGKVLIIKGTNTSFFIPPTGFEVVRDPITNEYVRNAVSLESLEYSILLDEDGTKRFEFGPAVIFPEPTEKFITRKQDSATGQGQVTDKNVMVKFKLIELNDQMGLFIKVISDYADGDKKYRQGDELFITGKEQRIYHPRIEHAVIEYGDGKNNFKRQRYYAIAVPKGEARYVLDKNTGKISMVVGEELFLPNPIHQVLVRRVLDEKTVKLWYPGNADAIAYNAELALMVGGQDQMYISAGQYEDEKGKLDHQRSINRTTSKSLSASASTLAGDSLQRSGTFTRPPQLTLDTKYEGVPTINVWTGYAVQVVNKSGQRRVVKGPATILLEYDETLEGLVLSTGNPKNCDNLWKGVYLKVDHNMVSDTIEVETKDMVSAKIKVSYRVNFEGDSQKWFAVENYVKFLCDRVRSMMRGIAKNMSIKELIDNSSATVRNLVLGTKTDEKSRPGLAFPENGMRVYDVEVLGMSIMDGSVASMIATAQKQAVSDSLALTSRQQELENAKILQSIETELAEIKTRTTLRKLELEAQEATAEGALVLSKIDLDINLTKTKTQGILEVEKISSLQAAEILNRKKDDDQHRMQVLKAEADVYTQRMKSVDPKLTMAIEKLADNDLLENVCEAIAPIAMVEQQGLDGTLRRLFGETRLKRSLEVLTTTEG